MLTSVLRWYSLIGILCLHALFYPFNSPDEIDYPEALNSGILRIAESDSSVNIEDWTHPPKQDGFGLSARLFD